MVRPIRNAIMKTRTLITAVVVLGLSTPIFGQGVLYQHLGANNPTGEGFRAFVEAHSSNPDCAAALTALNNFGDLYRRFSALGLMSAEQKRARNALFQRIKSKDGLGLNKEIDRATFEAAAGAAPLDKSIAAVPVEKPAQP